MHVHVHAVDTLTWLFGPASWRLCMLRALSLTNTGPTLEERICPQAFPSTVFEPAEQGNVRGQQQCKT